jgi:mRNA-degrading endonuclease toxin of MazEF toxin-antitoxin module
MNRNSSGRRYDREFKNNAVALVRGGRTITELPARSSQRGDVWQVDMGIAGKVRPCLLLTDYPADDELAMVTVLPHTTAVKRQPLGVEHSQTVPQVRSVPLPANSVHQRSLPHAATRCVDCRGNGSRH